MDKDKILYIYPSKSTFILRDVALLQEDYTVIDFFFDSRNKKKTPLLFIRQFFFLIRHIRSTKGIYCHFSAYHSVLPALFCKLFRKPCFIIVAGNDAAKFSDFSYGNYTRKLLGWATGFSLKNATCILPVHESLYYQDYSYYEGGKPAQGYAFFSPAAKRVPYVPVYYGYSSTFFRDYGNARPKNSFITIGNLADKYCFRRKGYDLILEIATHYPDSSFTIVGSPENFRMDTPPNVTVLSFRNQEEIVALLNEHEFYFQLSIMEGFPNALAESMLCGCIPIGSNVSGIPHIIGETGFILNSCDINELAELMQKVQDTTTEERQTLRKAARNRVSEHFSLERRKNALIQVLERYSGK